MRRVTVFFYGLFMDGELLREKGVSAPDLRPARVRGFALRIGKRATLVPSPDGIVHGMLAELTHGDLERLYSEAGLRDYRPEAIAAELPGGRCVPALCFNLAEQPSTEEHNRQYASSLRCLAEKLGFPPEYVALIR